MWFRVDDKLPNHAKTRRVRKSHPSKRRDAAPFGLWVLAGAFSDDGFIPLEVLEDWDDDAEALADRLVRAGLWIECEQAGEPGYRFHDWTAHNPADAATSGIYGNHKRWHVGGKKPSDDCPLCISEGLAAKKPVGKAEQEELSGRVAPESPPIIAPDSGRDIAPESGRDIAPESLPDPIRPDPTRSEPIRSGPNREAKRARQLPDDWQPKPETVAAMNAALPGVDFQLEHAKFKDHYKSNGKAMKDWDATWRNWMRRTKEFAAPAAARTDKREAMFADWEAKYGAPSFATNAIEGTVV